MAFTSRGTGRFSHKTHTVDGCGIAARAFDRRIYILRNFVHAAEDNNIFRSETERGKAVADAINILGGVDLEITESEFAYINSFITATKSPL